MLSMETGLNSILVAAFNEAKKRKHEFITPEHVLFASLNYPEGIDLIRACGGDPIKLQKEIDRFFSELNLSQKKDEEPIQSLGFSALLETAMLHVHSAGRDLLRFGDVLAAVFLLKESYAAHFLRKQGIERINVLEMVSHGNHEEVNNNPIIDETIEQTSQQSQSLQQFSTNLTQVAKDGLLDPVIGREDLIERTMQVLCRRQKNNPLHVGEPGVGKTVLSEALAARIATGLVPNSLKDHQIIKVDLSALLAGTKYRGDFEQRMKNFLSEVISLPKAILFIDEIHTLVGAGSVSGGAMDASNMLKPLLSNRKIRCIGATTYEEYRQHFEKDRGLSRRFQKIDVTEPSISDTVKILEGLKDRFERHHGVKYSSEALSLAVELSVKYIQERFLPDKAIDIIDEAGARIQLLGSEKTMSVGREEIETVVALMSNTPKVSIQATETARLARLESGLKEVVFGQNEAIKVVCDAIKRSRAGFREEERPLASLLFIGPSGVGKTELSRQLASQLGIGFLRFDMSEYQEKHSVSRLIGAPPGYIGFERGGVLTEVIRKNPYSVLLLDEIEKAHPDIFNTLLQIMDGATLTDSSGRKSDFHHIILVMTSNAGSREMVQKQIGFKETAGVGSVHKALSRTFSPEFRNRLDRIVVFNSLQKKQIRMVVDRQLKLLIQTLSSKNITMAFSLGVLSWLADEGYSEQFGAREIRRLIDEKVKSFLTDEILYGRLQNGGQVKVSLRRGNPFFQVYSKK